jgi:hypothetical protein
LALRGVGPESAAESARFHGRRVTKVDQEVKHAAAGELGGPLNNGCERRSWTLPDVSGGGERHNRFGAVVGKGSPSQGSRALRLAGRCRTRLLLPFPCLVTKRAPAGSKASPQRSERTPSREDCWPPDCACALLQIIVARMSGHSYSPSSLSVTPMFSFIVGFQSGGAALSEDVQFILWNGSGDAILSCQCHFLCERVPFLHNVSLV